MTPQEIVNLVCEVLEVPQSHLTKKDKDSLDARYIAITMMLEDGYKNKQIASELKVKRTSNYFSTEAAQNYLEFDKPFKAKYFKCIGRRAEIENDLI